MPTVDRRKHRTPRKLDGDKVLELRERGLPVTDIARHQNVYPSTVWRFLDGLKSKAQALNLFKEKRADCLANLGAMTIEGLNQVVQSILDDLEQGGTVGPKGVIKPLTPFAKTQYLNALNVTHGTTYDKERLERGQSTQNLSSHLLVVTDQQLFQPKPKANGTVKKGNTDHD